MFLGCDKDEWLVRRRDICDCSTVCLQTWRVLRSMCAAIFREKGLKVEPQQGCCLFAVFQGIERLLVCSFVASGPYRLPTPLKVISASLHLKCSIMACLGGSDIPTVRSPVLLVAFLTKSLEAIAPVAAKPRHTMGIGDTSGGFWKKTFASSIDISPSAVVKSARCVPRRTFHALGPRRSLEDSGNRR